MTVNTGISDLFFNHEGATSGEGPSVKDAEDFTSLLRTAGVPEENIPQPQDLVDDFQDRL